MRSRRIGGSPSRLRFFEVYRVSVAPPAEVLQEDRPGVLTGADEDGVRVRRRLVRQRRDVQPAHRHEHTPPAVPVGELVRAPSGRDVRLDDHQVGSVVLDVEALDVLVEDPHLVVVAQIAGQRGEAERRKQRVLDGPEERALRLRQRGQDHRHSHTADARSGRCPTGGRIVKTSGAVHRRCGALTRMG